MSMSINPINQIAVNSQGETSQEKKEPLVQSDNLRVLNVQKDMLLNASAMLQKYAKNPDMADKILMFEYQIKNLLAQIAHLNSCYRNGVSAVEDISSLTSDISSQTCFDSDIISLTKQVRLLLDLTNKALGIEPAGRDIVIASKKSKKAKPFDLSDKLLVLDEYQSAAVEEFKKGNTVMVTAPTGTGKTLIAEHIIDDILKSGKKVIYTTPLKALCNDKYKQFSKLWGDYNSKGELIGTSKVGLATGDAKINVNAPLVVMTTEIYRNMLVQQGKKAVEKELKNVDAVIFDEFHYMGNTQRGSVWEESVMFSPERMKFLMLSATVSNANPIKDWMNSINNDHKTIIVNVPEEERHVPLEHYVYSKIDGNFDLHNLTDSVIDLDKLKNFDLDKRQKEILKEIGKNFGNRDGITALENIFKNADYDSSKINFNNFIKELVKNGIPQQKAELYALRLSDKDSVRLNKKLDKMQDISYLPVQYFVFDLSHKNMTPALYFSYSKKSCKKLMLDTAKGNHSLLLPYERKEVQRRIDEIQSKGIFLGTDFEEDIKPCLLKGIAMHHSGMMPQCKSFIEELGRSKLIKICFATDTLGAGINFPFKTVVFSDFEKYGDYGFEEISTNEFKQGAGRAGRRGIDDIGYVISIPKNREDLIIPYSKVTMPSDEIQSAFNLSYGLILSPRFLNSSSEVLNSSFDKYQRKNTDSNIRKCKLMQEILKQRDFIELRNNKYVLTPKGKIASKVRGINEILLAEILTDKVLMENIIPSQLAELISVFAPDKEEKLSPLSYLINNSYDKKLWKVMEIAHSIRDFEKERGIESNIKINSSCAPYIRMWANLDNQELNIENWSSMIKSMLSQDIIKTEGDFLKKVNYTIDILKQVKKIAPTPYLQDTADQAIKMLQKSPVDDILFYELGYRVNNE